MSSPICITGANGFLAVQQLLEAGYSVHGTVRDTTSPKNAHLHKLQTKYDTLKLFDASFEKPESFEVAMAGCSTLIHTATPVPILKQIQDPMAQVIQPAIDGVRIALEAAQSTNVKRVIFTSSITALIDIPKILKDPNTVLTEDDWAVESSLIDAYAISKFKSESYFWDFVKSKKPSYTAAVVICPVLVGPQFDNRQDNSSSALIGQSIFAPKTNMAIYPTDVRDMAKAIITIVERPSMVGRYVVNKIAEPTAVNDILDIAYKQFPKLWTPFHAFSIPDGFLRWVSNTFQPSALTPDALQSYLNAKHPISGDKFVKETQFEYRPLEETVRDAVQSQLDHKILSPPPNPLPLLGLLLALALAWYFFL